METKKSFPLFIVIISCLLSVLGCDETATVQNSQDSGISMYFIPPSNKDAVGVKMADSIMAAWPAALDYDINIGKKGWEYTNGVVLAAFERLAQVTKQQKYLDYVKPYVDFYVLPDGTIQYLMAYDTTKTRDPRIGDVIQPSNLMIDLYKKYPSNTNYFTAMASTRSYFPNPVVQPNLNLLTNIQTNSLGGFFHKPTYQYQMWLDGAYMTEPFIVKYGANFAERSDKKACFDTAIFQLTLIAEKTYDPASGLYKHAWLDKAGLDAYNAVNPDAAIAAPAWADATTNQSPAVWSRGLGWYSMAVVDVLDNIPEHSRGYRQLVAIMNNIAKGLAKYQDTTTDLWYQVVDKGSSLENNFIETSGSAMFIYALEKAAKHGYISSKYLKTAAKAWLGLKTNYLIFNDEGVLSPDSTNFKLYNVVAGMGPKNTEADYAAVAKVDPTVGFNVPQGVAAVLLASTEMEFNHRDFHHRK